MKRRVKILILIAIIIIISIVVRLSNDSKAYVIRIAYTNDLSGFIFNDIENDKDNGLDFENYDFMDLGDCCGSSAQFAFATNQIDMAILCPDAVKYLDEINHDNYLVLGNITYDSDILISDKDKSEIKIVGYMNRRDKQREILQEYFGTSVSLVPMSPLSLGYAIKSNAIDAAYVDMSTYLQLDYNGITLTNDDVTQEVVINKRVKNSANIKKIIELYNKRIEEISDDNELFNFISKHLKLYDKEAVLKKWKIQKIKFGMLRQDD